MSLTSLLFPGQGAQQVGMGKDFAEKSAACRDLYTKASSILGYDLAALSFDGPIEALTISAHAQPAIFVASVAAYTALKEKFPDLSVYSMAGLSSGEWTALHLAGVLSFESTLKVLEQRGRLMQEACVTRPGSMLSVIGAEDAQLAALCEASGAEMANLNSREQTVLSGSKESIDSAEVKAKELGIRKAIRLNVAGAFHSSLMKPAADQFAGYLETVDFASPALPVIANVTGLPHAAEPTAIRDAMVRQVYSSVRWYQGIEWKAAQGVTRYVECGPGKVLSGLAKRIDKSASTHSIQELSHLDTLVA